MNKTEYQEALSEAAQALFAAYNMLSAVYDSSPSGDRKKARDDAYTAFLRAYHMARK